MVMVMVMAISGADAASLLMIHYELYFYEASRDHR